MLILPYFALDADVTSQSIISRLLDLASATALVAVHFTCCGLKSMLGNRTSMVAMFAGQSCGAAAGWRAGHKAGQFCPQGLL